MGNYQEFRWKQISQEAYSCLFVALGGVGKLKAFGGVTDMEGMYGEPLVMTEWGPKEADYPVLKSENNPKTGEGKTFIAYWIEEHA